MIWHMENIQFNTKVQVNCPIQVCLTRVLKCPHGGSAGLWDNFCEGMVNWSQSSCILGFLDSWILLLLLLRPKGPSHWSRHIHTVISEAGFLQGHVYSADNPFDFHFSFCWICSARTVLKFLTEKKSGQISPLERMTLGRSYCTATGLLHHAEHFVLFYIFVLFQTFTTVFSQCL